MKLNLSLFFFCGCPFIVIPNKRFPSSSAQMYLLGRLKHQLLYLGLWSVLSSSRWVVWGKGCPTVRTPFVEGLSSLFCIFLAPYWESFDDFWVGLFLTLSFLLKSNFSPVCGLVIVDSTSLRQGDILNYSDVLYLGFEFKAERQSN